MTKAVIQAMYRERVKQLFDDCWHDDTLKELQELNAKYGDGHRWCSYEPCLTGIIKNGNQSIIDNALRIYNKHVMLDVLEREYTNIGLKTNNMNI